MLVGQFMTSKCVEYCSFSEVYFKYIVQEICKLILLLVSGNWVSLKLQTVALLMHGHQNIKLNIDIKLNDSLNTNLF
jgi:hypothetical protein